jgi:hypothetical protein
LKLAIRASMPAAWAACDQSFMRARRLIPWPRLPVLFLLFTGAARLRQSPDDRISMQIGTTDWGGPQAGIGHPFLAWHIVHGSF